VHVPRPKRGDYPENNWLNTTKTKKDPSMLDSQERR
jgi:hypothetical protein